MRAEGNVNARLGETIRVPFLPVSIVAVKAQVSGVRATETLQLFDKAHDEQQRPGVAAVMEAR